MWTSHRYTKLAYSRAYVNLIGVHSIGIKIRILGNKTQNSKMDFNIEKTFDWIFLLSFFPFVFFFQKDLYNLFSLRLQVLHANA